MQRLVWVGLFLVMNGTVFGMHTVEQQLQDMRAFDEKNEDNSKKITFQELIENQKHQRLMRNHEKMMKKHTSQVGKKGTLDELIHGMRGRFGATNSKNVDPRILADVAFRQTNTSEVVAKKTNQQKDEKSLQALPKKQQSKL